jgi:hypothetical protein
MGARIPTVLCLAGGVFAGLTAACDLLPQAPVYAEPPASSYSARAFSVTAGGTTETVAGASVSPEFFPATRLAPLLGRTLLSSDFQLATRVAVISDGLWRQRFGANPGLIGTPVRLDDQPAVIVGIMPRGFSVPKDAEIWMPR